MPIQWTQEEHREKPRPTLPMQTIMMVNARGRVVESNTREAANLIGEGFHYAPKGMKVGEYIPVFDRGDKWKNESFLAPDIEEQLSSDTLEGIEI